MPIDLKLTPSKPYEEMSVDELTARDRELRGLESQIRQERETLGVAHRKACAIIKAENSLDKTLGNEVEEEAALVVLLARRKAREKEAAENQAAE